MEKPDYQGQGIFNLMTSVRQAFAPADPPDPAPACVLLDPLRLREARHVMLLVIDGLGMAQLEDHCPAGALAGGCLGPLSSVFPSTTASAITTYLTADAPARHGLTGWHMWFRELGVVATPLPFVMRGSRVDLGSLGIDAPGLLKPRSLFAGLDRESFIVQPEHLSETAYSLAHAGRARRYRFQRLSGLVKQLLRIGKGRRASFSYAYWPKLDTLSHIHGAHSEECARHLLELDQAVAALAHRLRGTGTLLLVCADHGFVDTRPQTRIRLEDHPDLQRTLLMPLCGEPRAVYCYVRAGAEEDFKAYIDRHLAHACEVHRGADLLAGGYLGPGPRHPDIHSRLGSHVLLMKDNYCLVDRLPGEPGDFTQVGVHGGMSHAELRVPLILFGP